MVLRVGLPKEPLHFEGLKKNICCYAIDTDDS